MISRFPLLCIALVAAGCAHAARPGLDGPLDESMGRRAALATLTVENRTGRPLRIAFRQAAAAGREVVVGRIAAGASGSMAPIPAGEPIILIARGDDGAELALPPRSFGMDAVWHWVIPEDTRFIAPEPRAP